MGTDTVSWEVRQREDFRGYNTTRVPKRPTPTVTSVSPWGPVMYEAPVDPSTPQVRFNW